jgi:hypothetical protein
MDEVPDIYPISKGIIELYDGAFPYLTNRKKRSAFIKDVFRVLENLFESGAYMKVSKARISDIDIIEMYNVSDRIARSYLKALLILFNKQTDQIKYAHIDSTVSNITIANPRKKESSQNKEESSQNSQNSQNHPKKEYRTIIYLLIDIDKIKQAIDKILNDVEGALEKYGRFIYEYAEYSVPGRFVGAVLSKKYSKTYKVYNIRYRFEGLNRYVLVITL